MWLLFQLCSSLQIDENWSQMKRDEMKDRNDQNVPPSVNVNLSHHFKKKYCVFAGGILEHV